MSAVTPFLRLAAVGGLIVSLSACGLLEGVSPNPCGAPNKQDPFKPSNLTVKVLDAASRPLAGQAVVIGPRERRVPNEDGATTPKETGATAPAKTYSLLCSPARVVPTAAQGTTNSQGMVSFKDIKRGEYQVVLTRESGDTPVIAVISVGNADASVTLTVPANPAE